MSWPRPQSRSKPASAPCALATTLLLAVLAAAVLAAPATAAPRLRPPSHGAAASAALEAERIAAYWTPARMRAAPPLDVGARPNPLAVASFAPVEDASVPPFSVNGRLFIRQGRANGYCSGTAIDSPTRRLVLTAGHCVNSGPRGRRGSSAWSRYVEFVPAYADGAAPFGSFIARRPQVFAPRPWVTGANSNYDVGAVLTDPDQSGVAVADAVGGGATLGIDRSRRELFQTFGYPGRVRQLQRCDSPATGEDRLTRLSPGPPTVRIRCHWLPGASGGGWLIEEGTMINGLTSYGRNRDRLHTFGPYFGSENVGELVAGL